MLYAPCGYVKHDLINRVWLRVFHNHDACIIRDTPVLSCLTPPRLH